MNVPIITIAPIVSCSITRECFYIVQERCDHVILSEYIMHIRTYSTFALCRTESLCMCTVSAAECMYNF